jgi:hypothetical protein
VVLVVLVVRPQGIVHAAAAARVQGERALLRRHQRAAAGDKEPRRALQTAQHGANTGL